jgi:two-component system LytT family response regulator
MRSDARKVRALVIDDELPARRRLRALLADESDVEIVGEAGGGTAAVQLILTSKPDLIFLDIQMPGLDGFGVLRAVAPAHLPFVVFVTAYDEHAIRAFDVAAVDYLLKPVDETRFRAAVRRAVQRARSANPADLASQLSGLLERLSTQPRQDRIPVRANGRVTLVRVAEIDWIGADGDQVKLHAGKETHVLRETMSDVEARLPATTFARIHRSTIVNVDRVREIQPWFKGDYVLVLQDGTRLMSGRTYRDRVAKLLG